MAKTLESRLAGTLRDLLQWSRITGGWESPCWREAKKLVDEFDKQKTSDALNVNVIIGQHPSIPDNVVLCLNEHDYSFVKKELLDAVEMLCKGKKNSIEL